tara:strand:+ start:142 stop:405 length:264 start_codon:yes stop_codon:yes gene_type:complete
MTTNLTKPKYNKEIEEKLEYFQDIFANDLVDLYSEIKDKVDSLALDLLNQETKTHSVEFIKMIFDSVQFELPSSEEPPEDEITESFY